MSRNLETQFKFEFRLDHYWIELDYAMIMNLNNRRDQKTTKTPKNPPAQNNSESNISSSKSSHQISIQHQSATAANPTVMIIKFKFRQVRQ